MKIAILGAGSMGSVFGGRLSLAGHDVWMIDVNEDHVRAIQTEGLTLTDGTREVVVRPQATTEPTDVGQADLVMVWCKAADTTAALQRGRSLFGSHTIGCTLQNGLGNVDVLAEVPPAELVYGVTGIATRFLAPGRVLMSPDAWDNKPLTWVGARNDGGSGRDAANRVADALTGAGIPTDATDDVDHYVWSKLATACAIAPLSVIGRVRQSDLLNDDGAVDLMRGLQDEVVSVAAANGIQLDRDEVWASSVAIYDAAGDHIGSMLQDVLACRPTEIDVFCGAVVRAGRRLSVPTPMNEAALAYTQVIERNSARQIDR
jgi:2-dehydropantoate 2-reductase